MPEFRRLLSDNELQQWEHRVCDTPDTTLAELTQRIGSEPDCRELDDIYWNGLEDHCNSTDIAEHVAMRLHLDSDNLLANIAPHRQKILQQYFRKCANRLRQPLELSDEEWAETRNHPVLYPELVFEGQGYYWEAVASYALEHDRLNVSHELQVFTQASLRFKLAHVLQRHLHARLFDTSQYIALAESTLVLMESIITIGNIPIENKKLFCFHAFEWLATEYRHNQQPQLAHEYFLKAAMYAPDVNLKINDIAMAASITAESGNKQEALRLLETYQDEAKQTTDPETWDMWEIHLHWLRYELGSKHDTSTTLRSPFTQGITQILGAWIEHDRKPDHKSLESIFQRLADARQELPSQDVEGQYSLILGLLRTVDPLQDQERWLALMDEATALEPCVQHINLRLDRQLLLARYETLTDPTKANQHFAALQRDVQQHMTTENKLLYNAAYLRSLSQSFDVQQVGTVKQLICTTLEQIQELFSAQPTSSARKRIREVEQGTIENALAAALTFAEHPLLEISQQQTLLKLAWQVFLATRNPELTVAPPEMQTPVHQQLTQAFEQSYWLHIVGRERGQEWKVKLERLLDYELTHIFAPAQFPAAAFHPPTDGLSLGFFQFREINQHIAVLMHHAGEYSSYLVDDVPGVMQALKAWRRYLLDGQTENLPTSLQQGLINTRNQLLFGKPHHLGSDVEAQVRTPWNLFFDGNLNEFPVDMLPVTQDGKPLACLRRIQHKLRASTSLHGTDSDEIDWQRGWLGLADVPSLAGFSSLPGTRIETENIQTLLQAHQCPTSVMFGAEAHASNLMASLQRQQPAVLHLAVHGIADQQYPEACALLLSRGTNHAAGELLLFRHIQQMDLRQVQLVVLSACSSSIGPTSRSAGLEGLVWAFLQAGAGQVVASRYSVNDHDTALLMQVFYRHLVNGADAVEALRLAKSNCLSDGMPSREIAAWGIWG